MRAPTRLNRAAGLTRRSAVLSLAAAASAAALLARRGQAATLSTPGSLASALAAALQRRQPLVVLASADHCGFCQTVRDNYLAPLQREERLPVVQLDLGSRAGLVGFDGSATTPDEALRHWRVEVAPTVLFFGPAGREVAPRLVGVSPDFYGAYLEQRLARARRAISGPSA